MKQNFIIKKFGGTSVGTPKNMRKVLEILLQEKAPKFVVLSALSGTTNALVNIISLTAVKKKEEAKKILDGLQAHYREFTAALIKNSQATTHLLKKLDKYFQIIHSYIQKAQTKEEDINQLLAQGELMSTTIFSAYLTKKEVDHRLISALDFIKTDENQQPDIIYATEQLNKKVTEKSLPTLLLTQGFICQNNKGEISNLQRGGSDYTASIIAAALKAKCCEIWTDIDGVHNNDPRIVERTSRIEQLSFSEASELAYFGAKVLHPTCIKPAEEHQIPVIIRNTMQPESTGTTISNLGSETIGEKAIAAKDNITAVRIKSSNMLMAYGFLTRVFDIFSRHQTPIDMITTSEVAVSLTIDNTTRLNAIMQELGQVGTVDIEHHQTIVCIVGHLLIQSTSLVKKIFNAIDGVPVRMISYGGSRNNISILIATPNKEKVLKKLNYFLFDLS